MMVLSVALGLLLLGLLGVDVFVTVFHASGRGGPLNRWQNRLLWSFFRAVGIRRDGTARERVLAYGGPAVVAVTLLVWLGYLVVAFFLLYLPFVSAFLVAPGELRTPWVEALTFSLYTTSTLGLGDVVPASGAVRVLAGVQAMSGFALFSISITYLLSVYSEVMSTRATATAIATRFANGIDATLARVARTGTDEFTSWAERINAALLLTLQAQLQYPVLNYFYSQETARALPVQIGVLLRAQHRVREAEPEGLRRLAEHPAFEDLSRTLEGFLADVDAKFLPRDHRSLDEGEADSVEERTLRRLVHYMGYPPVREPAD